MLVVAREGPGSRADSASDGYGFVVVVIAGKRLLFVRHAMPEVDPFWAELRLPDLIEVDVRTGAARRKSRAGRSRF